VDRPHALIVLAVIGCGEERTLPEPSGLATEIVSAPGATGVGFFDAALAVNGVRGGGTWQGGLDVFSVGVEDELVLGFVDPVLDVDGPDVAVFENPFDVRSGGRFFDPVVVEGSADCEAFVAFPFGLDGDPSDPAAWSGFAGLTPVLLHEEDNRVDPLSEDAGGDRFDLVDLPAGEPVTAAILADGLACVRLTSASAWTEPATGLPYPADPASNGPDIDGVYATAP
jgi:hypothetical protein